MTIISILYVFFLILLPPSRSTLFPYTTLFRSYMWSIGLDTWRRDSKAYFTITDDHAHLIAVGLDGKELARSDETISPSELPRSEEHTSELQSRLHLVCRLLLEKKKKKNKQIQ